jgi:sugar transferase (PEP-CTERM system associated)
MIKLLNQYFPGRLFVLLVTENVLIMLGLWAVISYRLAGNSTLLVASQATLMAKAFFVTVICQFCLYYADIYDLRSIGSRIEILMRVMQALGAAALILATLFWVLPGARLGAGIVETSLLAIVFGLLFWRIFVEWVNRAYGPGERILLVGSGKQVMDLNRELRQRADLPISIIGAVAEDLYALDAGIAGVETLGNLGELDRIIIETKPNRVIIALKERRQQLPIQTLLKFRMRGLLIEEASTLFQKITGKIPVESIHPSALIFTDGFRQSTWQRIYGRVVGLIAATLVTIFLGPIMLLLALLIKLDSKGPALYKQTRVGKNGQPFEIMKFRSMRVDAEAISGPMWAAEKDPRITRMGRILRKLRLDELPQFINVFRGEMSFVGPRPERPHFVEQLGKQIPFYDLRHSVRPGITGWAQVSLKYSATVEDSQDKLEYDLFYIKNFSLPFDFLILFQTIKIVMFGRGAR